VLFDLDDTVLRFSSGQPDYWCQAAEELLPAERVGAVLERIATFSREFWSDEARAFWGRQNMWEARRLIAARALGEAPESSGLARRLGDAMTQAKEQGVRPFEGAVEALHALRERGHRLGLLTNGCSEFQRRKLRRFDLEKLFEIVLVEGELGFGKPDERVFQRALSHFGRPVNEVCMVGDNLQADVAGAQRVGIRAVWHDANALGAVPPDSGVVPEQVVTRVAALV
jgi:putative hydrolase of the HAD superfamily